MSLNKQICYSAHSDAGRQWMVLLPSNSMFEVRFFAGRVLLQKQCTLERECLVCKHKRGGLVKDKFCKITCLIRY